MDILKRIGFIILIAVSSHLLVLLVKQISKFLLNHRTTKKRSPKLLSVISLLTSLLVFTAYFMAIGYILKELGVSLTAYIASASVIGLAIGFGSQGIIQDFVSGITLIISNQIDVGDMVEINGQTGIIKTIGIRFVVIENAIGAEVFIPTRNINVVINYPNKYISCFIDIAFPDDYDNPDLIIEKINIALQTLTEKYPKIFIHKKFKKEKVNTKEGQLFFRFICNIWPGRGTIIETTFRQEVLQLLRKQYPDMADWRVTVNYEINKTPSYTSNGAKR